MNATFATTTGRAENNKLSATAERFCRLFSLDEIRLATGDFSDAHLIGMGGFGKVYKGLIDNGQLTVAIKRLAPNSNQGAHEFLMEIETLSKLRHVNLVSLIGYCNESEEMILVYEYIPRGRLADHLYKLPRNSDGCSSLTWKQRLKACIGAGRGIDYPHTGSSIIHRDVKSTNILLDENFTAKVSDFGLARHLSTYNSQTHVSTVVKGSFGYLDPSYFTTCRLTKKSDIYAFGVVLLEVLCGRPAVDPRLGEDEVSLVLWAQEKISKGKVNQIVAPNLRDEISTDCLKTFVGVAKRCLRHEPKKRPTMGQVVVQLEFAFEQQESKASTVNTSRFLPLFTFWNIVKPSGNRARGSAKSVHIQVGVDALSIPVDETEDKQTDNVVPIDVLAIPLHELMAITNNFSSKFFRCDRFNVFCGVLKSGQSVVVKKVDYRSMPDQEFISQVQMVSDLKHENVAQLLGYCMDGGQKFLAYEIAQNGSLYDILHGIQGVKCTRLHPALSWAQRVKIAFGAAKGLEYIHEKALTHRNIKSSNVLLFDDMEVAKIADFVLSKEDKGLTYYGYYLPSFMNQSRGYDPPGCTWELSRGNDVYCFGVVLLELLTGGKLFDDKRPNRQQHLVAWVKSMLNEERVMKIIDVTLKGDCPPKAVAKMAEVATWCVCAAPKMSTVVKEFQPLLNAQHP